jgi:large subunit ribosomal protein L46
MNERLALPFTRYFYFKKGTPADVEWKRKVRERKTAARDIGVYNAYSSEGWNDEVLVGAPESEVEHQVEALIRDAESAGPGADGEEEGIGERKREAIPRPNSRVTEADRTGDVSSLNRRLDRTLYLLARQGDNRRWRFPESPLMRMESLQQVKQMPTFFLNIKRYRSFQCRAAGLIVGGGAQAAERLLVQSGGVNMNTWVVGNAPVGHHSMEHRQAPVIAPTGLPTRGEKTFFMKVRIIAGYPKLEGNELGLSELRWLCKEEIQPMVSPGYWKSIRGMLADR